MCQHTSGDIRLFYDKALVFDELYPLELSLALEFTIILQNYHAFDIDGHCVFII